MAKQVRFKDLLADPLYKKWLMRPQPKHPLAREPWRVFVKRKKRGAWAKKDFGTYNEALRFAASWVKRGAHDLAIHHRPSPLPGLVVKRGESRLSYLELPKSIHLADHDWCALCRRPTLFAKYGKHHAFPSNFPCNPEVRRCSICGGSEELSRPRRRYS